MELSHRFSVPASVEETWKAFNDLEMIAPCFPGATLLSATDDEFAGTVKIKLGPISMLYKGTGRFVERDEASHRAVIEAKGKDKRGNGTAGATVIATMRPDGSGTAVDVSTDLSITGKPAQFGRGVIQDVSDKLLGQFAACIEQKLGPEAETVPASGAAADIEDGASTAPVGPASASEDGGDHTAPTSEPTELNLVSTVLPALLRRYAVPGAIVLALVIYWVRRR